MAGNHNSGRRPQYPKTKQGVEEAAKAATPHIVEFWIRVMRDVRQDLKERIKCSELLMAYAIGKPKQVQEISGPGGAPIEQVHRHDFGDMGDDEFARVHDEVERILGEEA